MADSVEALDRWREHWPDQVPQLGITRPEDVWRHVQFGRSLSVARDEDDGNVYLSIECECAWEPEHGLQLVFASGERLSRVSPYDGH